MSKLIVFTLFIQQLLAAVFFYGRGGLQIFPAVTKGPHATTEATGKTADPRARLAAQSGCRLQKRGRGKARARRVKPIAPKMTSSSKKPNQRHTTKRDRDRSAPATKSPDSFPHDYAIYNARRTQPVKDEDELDYQAEKILVLPTSLPTTAQPIQLQTC